MGFTPRANVAITAAQNATPVPNFAPGANSITRGSIQTALGRSGAQVLRLPLAFCAPFDGAISGTSPEGLCPALSAIAAARVAIRMVP